MFGYVAELAGKLLTVLLLIRKLEITNVYTDFTRNSPLMY